MLRFVAWARRNLIPELLFEWGKTGMVLSVVLYLILGMDINAPYLGNSLLAAFLMGSFGVTMIGVAMKPDVWL